MTLRGTDDVAVAVRRSRRPHGADAAGEPRLAPADEAQANHMG